MLNRSWSSRPRRRSLVSLTPLIDVVFNLLLFFMLASSFTDLRSIRLDAPVEAGASDGERQGCVVEVAGTEVRVLGRTVPEEELVARVTAALVGRAEGVILLRPVEGASLQRLVSILDRLAAGGVGRVVLHQERTP